MGLSALLGVVWRRTQRDLDDKVSRTEIASLLVKVAEHIADDKELMREIRGDRDASEKSRAELHKKFNRMSLVVARLDERIARIGTREGEPLGPVGDGNLDDHT